jgi:hypothetical protein
MSLENTLKLIKQFKPFAEEDVSSGPPETLSGRRGRKAQAIEQMKRLKREYKSDLLSTARFIVISGGSKDEFTQIATENFYCFSSDPEEFYKDLINRIPPTLYLGKEEITNVFDITGRHLEDKMVELDISEYNQLFYKQEFSKKIEKTEDFLEMVKKVVNKQIGAEIVGIQAVASLVDKAIEKDHDGKITPILLPTLDEQLIADLMKDLERLTSRVYLVSAGRSSKFLKSFEGVFPVKEVTKESVDETLKSIMKATRK